MQILLNGALAIVMSGQIKKNKMIKIKKIHKRFGKLEVLKGIDLKIAQGEIVSIVGPSGAGKTTLLQIIGTLQKADSGEVLVNDKNLIQMSDNELSLFRNLNLGFVFQFHQLLPEFTALENVCIPAMIAGKKRKDIEERALYLLEFLNVAHRATHKPAEMSGGEQQRVAVARALINEPSVILADEPSGNLDTENKTDLHKLFFSLRDEFKQTFVIVTHNGELAQMSDRIIRMRDGLVHE